MAQNDVVLRIGAEVLDLKKRVRESEKAIERFSKRSTKNIKKTSKASSFLRENWLKLTVAITGAVGVFRGFLAIMRAFGEKEQAIIKFKTLTGSLSEAKRHYQELVTFAATTPFEIKELVKASAVLQAYSLTADEAMKNIKGIGDVAAISGKDINELAAIYGQVVSGEILRSRELNRLQLAGIPILQGLKEEYGKTGVEIRKMTEMGQISGEAFQKVFARMSQEGGFAFKGMIDQNKTLFGQWSNLQDIINQTMENMGEGFAPAMITLIKSLMVIVEKLGKVFIGLSYAAERFAKWFLRITGLQTQALQDQIEARKNQEEVERIIREKQRAAIKKQAMEEQKAYERRRNRLKKEIDEILTLDYEKYQKLNKAEQIQDALDRNRRALRLAEELADAKKIQEIKKSIFKLEEDLVKAAEQQNKEQRDEAINRTIASERLKWQAISDEEKLAYEQRDQRAILRFEADRELELAEIQAKHGFFAEAYKLERSAWAKRARLRELEKQDILNFSQLQIGNARTLSRSLLAIYGQETRATHRLRKGAALGQVAIDTARAIMSAVANYGPFAPVAKALILATAAAQIAAITSSHARGLIDGGTVLSGPGRSPYRDSVPARLAVGETVISRRLTKKLDAMGNREIQKIDRSTHVTIQGNVIADSDEQIEILIDRFNEATENRGARLTATSFGK